MNNHLKLWFANNKREMLRSGLMLSVLLLMPQICDAATMGSSRTMPWSEGINAIAAELTGPIPRILAVIAVATTGMMMAFGEMGQSMKKGVQIVFGVSIAILAVQLVGIITTGEATGVLF